MALRLSDQMFTSSLGRVEERSRESSVNVSRCQTAGERSRPPTQGQSLENIKNLEDMLREKLQTSPEEGGEIMLELETGAISERNMALASLSASITPSVGSARSNNSSGSSEKQRMVRTMGMHCTHRKIVSTSGSTRGSGSQDEDENDDYDMLAARQRSSQAAIPPQGLEAEAEPEPEEPGPLQGTVLLDASQVLKRNFADKPLPGVRELVKSCERPYSEAIADSVASASPNQSHSLKLPSVLPDWISRHRDFRHCTAKTLHPTNALKRATQMIKALRVPPAERTLSSILMIAKWLLEHTDLQVLQDCPRSNLMNLARALGLRRIRSGRPVYRAGDSALMLYVVVDGIAFQSLRRAPDDDTCTCSSPSSSTLASTIIPSAGSQKMGSPPTATGSSPSQTLPREASDDGAIFGPGRSFGFVAPIDAQEKRIDSVFNEYDREDALASLRRKIRAQRAAFRKAKVAGLSDEEAEKNLKHFMEMVKAPLYVAEISLATYFEEAAPAMSYLAEEKMQAFSKRILPTSKNWKQSKRNGFARNLVPRFFAPGDVVWRQGQRATSLAFIFDGTFAITREAKWEVRNEWPTDVAPERRACQRKHDGTVVTLETVSTFQGDGVGGVTSGVSKKGKRGLSAVRDLALMSSRGFERWRCSRLIVGEEPLLMAPEPDPSYLGIHRAFEERRRYTLRAVGPGPCMLLELPRNVVRRYLPYKSSAGSETGNRARTVDYDDWPAALQRQATQRHVDDSGVALAHHQRMLYESLTAGLWKRSGRMEARAERATFQQQNTHAAARAKAAAKASGNAIEKKRRATKTIIDSKSIISTNSILTSSSSIAPSLASKVKDIYDDEPRTLSTSRASTIVSTVERFAVERKQNALPLQLQANSWGSSNHSAPLPMASQTPVIQRQ